MTTFDTGRKAEAAAAAFLEYKGCQIIARNWRTRRCEIDIVAMRDGVVYFCEVKYRATNRHGNGLDYITPRKLAQMKYAAASWVRHNRWFGAQSLCAIEVSGPAYQITGVVKDLL